MEGKPPATIECRSAGPDLPQALIAGREDTWLRHFFSGWRHDPMTISGKAFETYVNATAHLVPYGRDLRLSRQLRRRRARSRRIRCPVHSLWGQDFGAVCRLFDMNAIWSGMVENLSGAPIERCGDLPHEERPERSIGFFSTSSRAGMAR